MRERLTRVVFLVYPQAWRDRYGDEVRDLTDELASTDHASSWRLVVGLFLSGLVERVRSWQPRRRIVYTSAGVVLAAVAVVSLSMTTSRSPDTSPRVTSVHAVGPTFLPDPGTGSVVPSTKAGLARVRCIVTLNPKTGATISAKPAANDPTGCSA
jgi:hypothetical protein